MKQFAALLVFSLQFTAFSQTSVSPLECVSHFYHGVASGDPLTDAVIIWTRITPEDFNSPVVVSYKMATDTAMTNIVSQGSLITDASKDFTVKFDVQNLDPDTYYFYEFTGLNSVSPRGRTKTAPTGNIDSLRFAVVSCANLEAGYFNVYDIITERNDIEAVLMLGDYIYEYENGGYSPNGNIDRIFDPTNEIISLDDYRMRYSIYHMDHALQKLHQNFPWICVWDDHESANDSYKDGAENHNLGEGLWSDRKLYSQQAYFEWLPIRPKAPQNYEIYRTFSYGDLLDLFMVDTRLNGREEQGVNTNDPDRTILGPDQYNWLTNELDASTAQWKVLGNQIVVAPINVFGIPINQDAWDGYPAERTKLFQHILSNDIKNFSVITGDIHTSWAFNLKEGGQNVGVEFVAPSVTSPGAPINGGSVLMIENPHIKYVELTKRGFVILDVNQTRMQADWFYVNTIDAVNNGYSWAKSFYTNNNSMSLQETNSASLPDSKYEVGLAPSCPRIIPEDNTSIDEISNIHLLGVYPNPAVEHLNVLLQANQTEIHEIKVIDLKGEVLIIKEVNVFADQSTIVQLNTNNLASGTYLLSITNSRDKSIAKFVVK